MTQPASEETLDYLHDYDVVWIRNYGHLFQIPGTLSSIEQERGYIDPDNGWRQLFASADTLPASVDEGDEVTAYVRLTQWDRKTPKAVIIEQG